VTKACTRLQPLDLLNFFLADVRGAFGPYLGIFLLTEQRWSPATIGLVMTIGGLVGLTVQTPVGAYIDAAIRKRAVGVIASAVLAAAALAVMLLPSFIVVLTANTMMAVAGDVFAPAVAAITLGLYGRNALAKRMGRNAAFDHAGNVAIALIAAGVGWSISQRAVFLLVPLFAACVSLAVLSVPAGTIDHARARGLDSPQPDGVEHPASLRALFSCRP